MVLDFQIPHPSIVVLTSFYLQRWKQERTLNFKNYPLTCSFPILGWNLWLLIGIVLAMKHRRKGREPWDSRDVWVSWSLWTPRRAGEGCSWHARSQAAEGYLWRTSLKDRIPLKAAEQPKWGGISQTAQDRAVQSSLCTKQQNCNGYSGFAQTSLESLRLWDHAQRVDPNMQADNPGPGKLLPGSKPSQYLPVMS